MCLWIENLSQILSEAPAVCSEWGGHHEKPGVSHSLCQCSGWTQSSRLTYVGPKITPHPNQLSTQSGWDVALASQMWSVFWLLVESFSVR